MLRPDVVVVEALRLLLGQGQDQACALGESVESVRHELRQTLDNAWAVQRALQSIFVQQAIRPEDEAKPVSEEGMVLV